MALLDLDPASASTASSAGARAPGAGSDASIEARRRLPDAAWEMTPETLREPDRPLLPSLEQARDGMIPASGMDPSSSSGRESLLDEEGGTSER